MVQANKAIARDDQAGLVIDDTVRPSDDPSKSELYQEYLQRSKLKSDDLPSSASKAH